MVRGTVACRPLYVCLLATLLALAMETVSSDEQPECTQSICRRRGETLECPSSIIMVVSVTSSAGMRDDAMLRVIKRTCMGTSTCDVSNICPNNRQDPKIVSYLCVRVSLEAQGCTGSPVKLHQPHGFLQNPGYPSVTNYRACHWRIEPAARTAVHLTLHDLDSHFRATGRCEKVLHITAHSCDPEDHRKPRFTEHLCVNDTNSHDALLGKGQPLTIVSCGPVDVRLTPARNIYPLRFWLGYSIKSSRSREPIYRSLKQTGLLAQCPGSGQPSAGRTVTSAPWNSTLGVLAVTMTTTNNQSVTSVSGESDDSKAKDQSSTLTVLIVLVCVIGVIALTLTVVLVLVCLKRRRPKVELIEHVYAVPGQCQTLGGGHALGAGPPYGPPPAPGPRPRLLEPYCDVADARPPDQPPQRNPASPAYAEVEEVCDLEVDDATLRRFHFPASSRPTRPTSPSASSAGGSSAHYEDVNPLPPSASASASASAMASAASGATPAARNRPATGNKTSYTLPYLRGDSSRFAGNGSASPAVKATGVGVGGGIGGGACPAVNTTGRGHAVGSGRAGSGPLPRDGASIGSRGVPRETPVYVHVVDAAADTNNSTNTTKPHVSKSKYPNTSSTFSKTMPSSSPSSKTQRVGGLPLLTTSPSKTLTGSSVSPSKGRVRPGTSSSNTQTELSAVGPLAAKYSAPSNKPSGAKVAPKANSDTYGSSRRYPLQEGKVAALVSTLNRTKGDKRKECVNTEHKVS